MPWWLLFSLNGPRLLLKPDDGGSGGGGSGGSGTGGSGSGDGKGGSTEVAEIVKAAVAEATKGLVAEINALKGKKGDPPKEGEGGGREGDGDPDLRERARLEREANERKAGEGKNLEAALRFSLGADTWLKQNASLLPKDIPDIFKAAETEKYDSAIEKDAAIKAGIVQSFFAQQANMDLLTPAVKADLEDYLKLTKTGKQDRAQQVYDRIFEPAFEMLRRLTKADQLRKGHGSGGAAEDAYKNKMVELSRKHYLGETK